MKAETKNLKQLALYCKNQQELAKQLDVSQASVSRYLHEKSNMGGPVKRLVTILLKDFEQQHRT